MIQPGQVSVVIPVHNGVRFVAQAIESVLRQTYHPVEVIAVDDGSMDGSADALRQYGERITVIEQSNQGVAAARNAGIERARGEYIAFLDQDDWWLPEKMARQVAILRAAPVVGLVHCEAFHFDDVAGTYVERFNNARSELLVGKCYERLLEGNGIFNSTVIVRASVLNEVGKFNTDIGKNSVQDYDLWLRCAKATEFEYIPEKLAVYRLHPQQGMWQVATSHLELIHMLESVAGVPEGHQLGGYRKRCAQLLEELGIEYLDESNSRAAQDCFRRSLRLSPSPRRLALVVACCLPDVGIGTLRKARAIGRRLLRREVSSRVPAWTGRVNNRV